MSVAESILPGIYITERAEGLAAPQGGNINTVLVFGTANRGAIGTPTPISAEREVSGAFGFEDAWNLGTGLATQTPLGLARGIKMALKRSSDILAIRVGDGTEAKAAFAVKDASLNTIATLTAKTEGTWAHDIDIYIEDSEEAAVIENEQFAGNDVLTEFSLEFNNIVKSVQNSFVVITPSGTDNYDPVYYRHDTLDYAGSTTDKTLSLQTERLAQAIRTHSNINLDELTISMKKSEVALGGVDVDAVWQYDDVGGTPDWFSMTTEANNAIDDDLAISLATRELDDSLFIGHSTKFKEINIQFTGTTDGSNDDATIVYEYWNGSAWTVFSPTDGTSGLTGDGSITFDPGALISDWTAVNLNVASLGGTPPDTGNLFWFRIRVTAAGLGAANSIIADSIDITPDDMEGTVTVGIYNVDTNGDPDISGGLVDANATLTIDVAADVTASYTDIVKSFAAQFTLNQNKTYALVFDAASVTFNEGTVDWEVVDDTVNYYEDGNQIYYNGATWSIADFKKSLLFQLKPVVDSNDVGVRMRSWDSTGTGSMFFLNAPLTGDTVNATYKVSADNNKVKKIVFDFDGNKEEFISISGDDLARDINNASTGSLWFDAAADGTFGANTPGLVPDNGTEEFPKSPMNGDDGAEASPSDFEAALNASDTLDAYLVVFAAAGRYNFQPYLDETAASDDLASLHALLKAHVEKMQSDGIERMTILGMRESKATERISSGFGEYITSADDSVDNRMDALGNEWGRVVFIAAGIYLPDPVTETNIIMSGQMTACLYAGLISSIPGWKSPTRESLSGAVDVEINFNLSARKQLRTLNVSVVEKSGSIRILQGVTTDSTGRFIEINVRRTTDYVRIQIKLTLDGYIGEPNTEEIRGTIESVLNSLFDQLRIEGYITKNYSVDIFTTVSGEAQGKVNADLRFQPVKPINKFLVTAFIS